ncbi:FAD-binding oxidoreductase [Paracoccus sp. IB05]|uniref:FAD-binding oxidoreductase n=1 Tax=Paracoccus sp. IB05 TaxID=2779367 RepID=UPI0018E7A8DA|nr:FAD-binding oxidoreductase [Paracoccus sp. IB05]MBJ2152730.1 FAD-binding oxidoreductase [Paracoccus sp. IB05]
MSDILSRLRAIPGLAIVTDADDMAPHLVDWRRRHSGAALALVLPSDTAAVSAVLRACFETGTPVFPQGGNTSVCGGSVPDESGAGIILNLARMNAIRKIDADDDSIIVEAGCILQKVQEAAASADRLFPMSLGAEGSCQIGGNIATNAGGTGVLRYGNMRDLVLGLEVVLADGTVWEGLRTLRKNNSGYDLRNLFAGSEGTLGVITAAALRLFPRPPHTLTAMLAARGNDAVLALARQLRSAFPGEVSALEILSQSQMAIVLRHVPGAKLALPEDADWYLLAEVSGSTAPEALEERLTDALAPAFEAGAVLDAVLATSERQRGELWGLRHHVTEGNVKEGMGLTHDIAVPLAQIGPFIAAAGAWLARELPQAVPVVVGHLGDGNLHYIAMFSHADWAAVSDKPGLTAHLNHALYDIAAAMGGTFSAEHGVGSIHIADMARYKPEAELRMMRAIRQLLDPKGLMNPGRVLP